ncbi:CAP domain-containing protein [Pengzhenrongella sicca]|uniref:CAP domain-containing protein n=1 Tax=Pengzhenrongella sicca TaxID=2819238 RepID=A0A8A4ZDA8_9MICO|nr:CAP domain-containing protein [Pengzhenrongella sicca]QTE29009.1 CAP domain-containing protein [Pengzhenrongella sicca]
MGARCLAAGLGVVVLMAGCAAGPTPSPSSPTTPAPTSSPAAPPASAGPGVPGEYAAELVAGTDAARADEGLPALAPSACAQAAALERAAALVGAAELTHASLAGVIAACAPATTAAENLSRATAAPAEVLAAWLDSPGHRANLLDPDLTELGIGCVPDGAEMLCSQVYLGP